MCKRIAAVLLAIVSIGPAFAVAQDAPVSQKLVAEQVVDAFASVYGTHPGARVNHAKGVTRPWGVDGNESHH